MKTKLFLVKLLHSLIWAIFAGSILSLPFAAIARRFDWVLVVTVMILGEGLVLAINQGSCPLTRVAARYTSDRADNFDIFLPRWLARYNKMIFTALFLLGEVFALWQYV